MTREELAEDIVSKLKEFGYRGAVNGTWGEPSQDALERFNTLAKLDLPLDEPEPATLDALKDWNGAHCAVEAAVPGHKAKSKHQAVRPPVKTYKKAVTPKATARAAPGPTVHSGGGGDEQQELQRLFPQSAWPGKR